MKNYCEMRPEDEVDLKIDGVKVTCDVETLLFICHVLGLRTDSFNEETNRLTLKPNVNDGFFLNFEKNKRKKEIEKEIKRLQDELKDLG